MKTLSVLIFLFGLLTGCGPASHNPPPTTNLKPKGGELQQQRVFGEGSYLINTHFADKKQMEVNSGMGVAVYTDNKRCVLLTCKHLVSDAEQIIARSWVQAANLTRQGKNQHSLVSYPATILLQSREADLALIEIKKPGCKVQQFADRNPAMGDAIQIMGQPVPGRTVTTRGIVSGYWDIPQHGHMLLTDAFSTSGFSGSAAVDANSNIVGIVSGKTKNSSGGFAYVVPISRIFKFRSKIFSVPKHKMKNKVGMQDKNPAKRTKSTSRVKKRRQNTGSKKHSNQKIKPLSITQSED